MSKDLTKEYKEAVMNDLPDLWSRIEASLDDIDKKSETKEDNVIEFPKNDSNVLKETKSDNIAAENKNVNSNNLLKYSVNAFDNTPEKGYEKNKKRKKIPAWVMISLPSVAILVLAIVPIAFFASLSSGTKNYSSAEPMAATDSFEAYYEAVDYESDDACDSMGDFKDEAPIPESAGENKNIQTPDSNYNYLTTTNDDPEFDFDLRPGVTGSENEYEDEDLAIVNDSVVVKILSTGFDEQGRLSAQLEIAEVLGRYSFKYDGFEEFKPGDVIEAYLPMDYDGSEEEFEQVTIQYVPFGRIRFRIEFSE